MGFSHYSFVLNNYHLIHRCQSLNQNVLDNLQFFLSFRLSWICTRSIISLRSSHFAVPHVRSRVHTLYSCLLSSLRIHSSFSVRNVFLPGRNPPTSSYLRVTAADWCRYQLLSHRRSRDLLAHRLPGSPALPHHLLRATQRAEKLR